MTQHSPDNLTCQELLKAILKGLSICGIQPTDEAMLFEVRLLVAITTELLLVVAAHLIMA